MQVPLSWLKNYVPVLMPPKELAHRLTMAGTEIGTVQEIGHDWDKKNLLVGQILKLEPHPNADRLSLPTVDLGNGETATVVCGAPNIAVGQKVAFAKEGARLFNVQSNRMEELKATKIRGVTSAGMICSELELGLGNNHMGILVLEDHVVPGMPLVDCLGDSILDAEVTPNRPDCLSILGIAHEVAALTGEKVTEPDCSYKEESAPIQEQIRVEITAPQLCRRYAASLIHGVKVEPSPAWLQNALSTAGQRPINNIVDITNYVMLEYGQPLHAFDFDLIKNQTVIVRAAQPEEKIKTLDDESLELQPPMLAIADARDAIALAGVIGGSATAVHEKTTSILVESANFDPVNTRRTAAALHQRTEASYRFERGIRAELVPRALRRATHLIIKVAGGKSARGIIDIYPGEKAPPVTKITRKRLRQVLGIDLPIARVESVLTSLGFERSNTPKGSKTPKAQEKSTLWMKSPYWRSDIAIEDDLVEEVARVVGYDNIPTNTLSTSMPHHEPQHEQDMRDHMRDILVASGMQEIISYSLTDSETLDKAEALVNGPEPLRIANPMSSELQLLRTSLRGSMLKTLASNRRISREDGIRLFEIGRTYLPKEGNLPYEKECLIGVISGPHHKVSWLANQRSMDFFDAKGILESLFNQLGICAKYEPTHESIMCPGKTARLVCNDQTVGVVGELHPRVLAKFNLDDSPAILFEIDLESLHQVAPEAGTRYSSASRFPQSERDLALIVDAKIPSASIQSIIQRHKLVKSSSPFDLYVGQGIPAGKKSIAYKIIFQSPTETLTAEQVNQAQEEVIGQLQRETNAELRG